MRALFPLGQVVTLHALNALEGANASPVDYLQCHVSGDRGDLCAEDVAENRCSVEHGFRILSS